eukprot:8403859-Pyramimonas_sp.AAC.1
MSATQLEQVVTSFGASGDLARELVSVMGRVRQAAVKAKADREAEAAREQAQNPPPAAQPEPGAASSG